MSVLSANEQVVSISLSRVCWPYDEICKFQTQRTQHTGVLPSWRGNLELQPTVTLRYVTLITGTSFN